MTNINKVSTILELAFTYFFYPLIFCGIFLCIYFTIRESVGEGEWKSRVRKLVGAILPFVALVFFVVSKQSGTAFIANFIESYHSVSQFFFGGILGLLLLESGRYIENTEVGKSVYNMFLSSVGVFILYSAMEGALSSLNTLLLGMIIAGGLHIVFRGLPNK